MSNEFHPTMQQRGVLTLPAEVRKRLHLDESGAQVRVVELEDGVLELHPERSVPADQVWFWSERWQRMERETDAEKDLFRTAVRDFNRG